MIESANTHLHFQGQAMEAIELYKSALGAKVAMLMQWRDMPGREVAADVADQVMYARLEFGGGAIELGDSPGCGDVTAAPGAGATVSIHCNDPAELDTMYAALSAGGTVEMAPENTFWNARYGKLRDRFGVSWSFNCPLD